MIPIVERASLFIDRDAIRSEDVVYTYRELLQSSIRVTGSLLGERKDLEEEPIAFMVPPSFLYTSVQWGIWQAGGIAVPLCDLHPLPSIRYVLENTGSKVLIVHPQYFERLHPLAVELGIRLMSTDEMDILYNAVLPEIDVRRRAMILYTSGTTSAPKGVVTTHQNIDAQITTLVKAWQWNSSDKILNVLPLHHVHGIINVMSCALYSGACCEFLPKFDAEKVWQIFCSGRVNVFMAVPTIYFKLIAYWDNLLPFEKEKMSTACRKFRLFVSGSAALPESVLEKWKSITEHTLLERYGMTEIGMALSNPYKEERRPGHVGLPLPGVEIRLVDDQNVEVENGEQGEIQVQSTSVFEEYWQKEEATKNAFTNDGWFRTGDIAKLNDGYYKILGRDSMDIIKSGGYKISALEIEEKLRMHPLVNECAVVGLPDEEWGEIIGASIVSSHKDMDTKELSEWLKEYLPDYKIPRKYIFQNDLPRNTLGKVTKNQLKKHFS